MKKHTLCEALRLLRVHSDLSQTEMAGLTGLSQSMVSEIESQKKYPSIDAVTSYAEALQMSMWCIFLIAENLESAQEWISTPGINMDWQVTNVLVAAAHTTKRKKT